MRLTTLISCWQEADWGMSFCGRRGREREGRTSSSLWTHSFLRAMDISR